MFRSYRENEPKLDMKRSF